MPDRYGVVANFCRSSGHNEVGTADGTGHRNQAGMQLGDSGAAQGPLSLFCARLRHLQVKSGISQARLAAAAHLGKSQMSDMLNGKIKKLPEWDLILVIVRVCLEYAATKDLTVPPDLRDETDWRRRHADLERDLDAHFRSRSRREAPPGWPLADTTDPFALEVHRPVRPDTPQPGLPALPAYLHREHDAELERVVAAAAHGDSKIAVLVGGSSTGKTRACWEALELLRDLPKPWRLWHPIDPTRPQAALRELPSVSPRTVIWLNEAQFYLDVAADGLGEQIAAGLREILRSPAKAPILVLATLWPEHWNALTVRPPRGTDPHAQARELLQGKDITVPTALTANQVHQLRALADPRLVQAADSAEGGQVVQFLAGAPELTARYRNAPPVAAALINAAIDARRLGMGIALPLAFLENAAPAYLTDTDWDVLGEDWLEQALAYTAAPCRGIRGPLAPIRPRPARSAGPVREPACRLADYLEQDGRRARRAYIPPAGFWDAVVGFADPGDLAELATAARERGLLRDAARLRRLAVVQGDADEASALIGLWHSVHPHASDPKPGQWVVAHAALDNPGAVMGLLDSLLRAGAYQQAAALLARDPAAHVTLDDLDAVTQMLNDLRLMRWPDPKQQAAALAARAAAHAHLDDPGGVAWLLPALRQAGAERHAAALLARDPARHANLDHPGGVARLLSALREAGAEQQAAALLARNPAAHVGLDPPGGVIALLDFLRKAGEEQQAAVLIKRAAEHADLDSPHLATLLLALRRAGAEPQAAALAARAAEHADLDSPHLATLLLALRMGGAEQQAAALAARAAQHVRLYHPHVVAIVLYVLRMAGAEQQAAALAARAAAHVALNPSWAVAQFLNHLREAGAVEHVATVLARDPAAHVALDHPDEVGVLLTALRRAGAEQQAAALAARAAAHVALDHPWRVAVLLNDLRQAGAEQQAAALAARAAAHVTLDYPDSVLWAPDRPAEDGR